MSARARAERLSKLYGLRAAIEEEIHDIEASMVNEAEMVRQAREQHRPRASVAPCGTDSGYYRHLRRTKQPACPACLAAHAAVTRERAARKKTAREAA